MNGIWLVIPLLAIRFVLLGLMNRAALRRAAHFPPLVGKERIALLFYQISNVFLLVFPLALVVETDMPLLAVGLAVYAAGIAILVVSTICFAKPKVTGINTDGIYRFSRNPMYIGYFVYFLGCALLTRSWPMLFALAVFIVSSHWIILSEERWCLAQFGREYKNYMHAVRRYL